MGRTFLALFAIWFLTTGSNCSASVSNGRGTFAATDSAAAISAGVILIGIGIYCIAYTEECFPDEEALQAQADAFKRARATYTAGLRRHQNGDPTGLEWICLSAHQGYARAQFYYGAYLYHQGPDREAESIGWLWRAAAQGHPEADMMLRQVAGVTVPIEASVNHSDFEVAPPSIRACASTETALNDAAMGDRPL